MGTRVLTVAFVTVQLVKLGLSIRLMIPHMTYWWSAPTWVTVITPQACVNVAQGFMELLAKKWSATVIATDTDNV
jgi:hypothetical protein